MLLSVKGGQFCPALQDRSVRVSCSRFSEFLPITCHAQMKALQMTQRALLPLGRPNREAKKRQRGSGQENESRKI